jgi:hypothetical protein
MFRDSSIPDTPARTKCFLGTLMITVLVFGNPTFEFYVLVLRIEMPVFFV